MDLKGLNCQNLSGYNTVLTLAEKKDLKNMINSEWNLIKNDSILSRQFTFKNFKTAFEFVSLVSSIAEGNHHHPDIHFGWAYCLLEITTHSLNDLTKNDFILAHQFDEMFLNFSKN